MKDFDDYIEDIDDAFSEIPDSAETEEMPPLPEYDNGLEYEYQQAKDSIEFSRNEEERAYWQKRADELWEKRDEADFEARNNKVTTK